jgi:hypothetical protein
MPETQTIRNSLVGGGGGGGGGEKEGADIMPYLNCTFHKGRIKRRIRIR